MTWEERWHPLRSEWVLIAAHRQDRPWQGGVVRPKQVHTPAYDPECYLCPNNRRVSGQVNAPYTNLFVFDNDHPCVSLEAPSELEIPPEPYRVKRAEGVARVVCYSPRHDLTLAELEPNDLARLFQCWQIQFHELGALPFINHVLIFENKGEVVGVSNPHPHCQIYATNFVFKTIETELAAEREYQTQHGRVLFQDVLRAEQQSGNRILAENDVAIAFLPYFARYGYETYVAPKRTVPDITHLSDTELEGLAQVTSSVLVRFDNLWQTSFPYVMALHQAPTDGAAYPWHHFFIQFLPPLRKPNVLKYLAGPEVGGGCFVSDMAPEKSAQELLATPSIHYKKTPSP